MKVSEVKALFKANKIDCLLYQEMLKLAEPDEGSEKPTGEDAV